MAKRFIQESDLVIMPFTCKLIDGNENASPLAPFTENYAVPRVSVGGWHDCAQDESGRWYVPDLSSD